MTDDRGPYRHSQVGERNARLSPRWPTAPGSQGSQRTHLTRSPEYGA